MARYLLDTDAIIDYLRGFQPTVNLIRQLHDRGDTLCVCDVVVAEVYAGLRPQHRDAAERLVYALDFLPTSASIARQAGQWRYDFARKGVTLAATDILIAATAEAHGASVVTGIPSRYPMPERILSLDRTDRTPANVSLA